MKYLIFVFGTLLTISSCSDFVSDYADKESYSYELSTRNLEGELKDKPELREVELLNEIQEILFTEKENSENLSDFTAFDKEGNKLNLSSSLENFEGEILYAFKKKGPEEPQVSCCWLDFFGWNEYDETKWLILGYGTEHYTVGMPLSAYKRSEWLRQINPITGEKEVVGPWAQAIQWDSFQTDCYDDYFQFYGWAIPPNWLNPGTYYFEACIGFEYESGDYWDCACDEKRVYFGWPF